ncbi:hypothetical protein ATCC90586_005116 [Pythium insidiosum]|nr:hypothetical protein ATCC90586_005116 [Pythium insidiosum]
MAKPKGAKQESQAMKGKPAKQQAPSRPAGRGGAARNAPAKPSKHGDKSTTSSPAASAEVTALVTRMAERSLAWYNAGKPLKQQAPASSASASAGKKNKRGKQAAAATALKPLDEALVKQKKAHAQQLYEQEVARHEGKRSSKMSSDDKYLATMISKGTLADRVAALTLTVQASPFHSLSRLGQLITMASKKARRESLMAVESLKDLFINNLLPDDRKLLFFHQNPLEHPDVTDEHLALWFYEHCLKTAFAQLVGVLSGGMNDAVDNHKRACIRAANALLSAKPEQEAVLLGMLVNKLGDPDRKVASYIHKTLQELLRDHPLMKRVVVDEVERLLTRSGVTDRTKYNAVLFLSQIVLRKDDDDDTQLASHLISVYFALFSKEVHAYEAAQRQSEAKRQHKAAKKKQKGGASTAAAPTAAGLDRKLLSALLVGVNRAFPYAKTATSADLQSEIDTLLKVVRVAHHFHTSVQALMLLFQVMSATNSVSDRFYTALYEKLLDPKLRETSKHTLFLNLVFRAMKADVSPARTAAMMKRLLQLTSVMTPAFTCAVLFLLSEVLKVKPQLRTLLDQPEAAGADKDDEHFADHDKSDNQVFRPEDDEDDDEEASDDEAKKSDDEDDEELPEGLNDGLTDAERTQKVLAEMFGGAMATEPEAPRAAASFDDDATETAPAKDSGKQPTTATSYDWQKRNPLFAGAETSCAWEIHHLLCHYHPSVQMFAQQLIANGTKGIEYAGDPLVDFTMHAFFEKFMNKKPRHKQLQDGGAAAPKTWSYVPINTEAVLEAAPEAVDASDQFFYKFFKERATRDAAAGKKKKQARRRGGDDDDDRDGDAFSDFGSDEEEDDEMEAFAQQLAEGIMDEGDLDDEDPDMGDWSGPEDDGDDDDEGRAFGDDDDDEDDDEAMAFGGSDDDDEGGAVLDDEDDDDDDDDDEDGFDFDAMDDGEDLATFKKKKATQDAAESKAGKRSSKSLFASADDYETIMKEALAKQQARDLKRKSRTTDAGAGERKGGKPKQQKSKSSYSSKKKQRTR